MRARFHEFLRFCIVGFIGFATDAAGLELFVMGGLTAPLARLCSIAIALQVTFVLHSLFTFRGHDGFTLRRWAQFILLNLLGALINYATFLTVWTQAMLDDPQLQRQLALLAGTVIALGFNYWSNGKFVFTKRNAE